MLALAVPWAVLLVLFGATLPETWRPFLLDKQSRRSASLLSREAKKIASRPFEAKLRAA
jgi:hypothetical protein